MKNKKKVSIHLHPRKTFDRLTKDRMMMPDKKNKTYSKRKREWLIILSGVVMLTFEHIGLFGITIDDDEPVNRCPPTEFVNFSN